PRLHLAREQRVVLAQRVPLELEREVEVTQRGMTVECDAEHLPGLALVPIGARIHRYPRLGARVVLVDIGLEDDALMRTPRRRDDGEELETARGTTDAVRSLLRLGRGRRVARTFVGDGRRGHPVDR